MAAVAGILSVLLPVHSYAQSPPGWRTNQDPRPLTLAITDEERAVIIKAMSVRSEAQTNQFFQEWLADIKSGQPLIIGNAHAINGSLMLAQGVRDDGTFLLTPDEMKMAKALQHRLIAAATAAVRTTP